MRIDHGRIRLMALSAFIIAIMLMSFTARPLQTAAAESTETIDLERKGSISIRFVEGQSGEPFSFGTKVGVFRVADISLVNGLEFVYDELFESVGDPPTLASQFGDDLADRLEEVAEFKGISLEAPSIMISEAGKVTFSDFTPGLFLIVQTHRGTDSPNYQVRPFMVTLPVQAGDGSFVYDVEMEYRSREHGQGSASLVRQDCSMVDSTSVPAPEKVQETRWPVALAYLGAGIVLGFLITRLRRRYG